MAVYSFGTLYPFSLGVQLLLPDSWAVTGQSWSTKVYRPVFGKRMSLPLDAERHGAGTPGQPHQESAIILDF